MRGVMILTPATLLAKVIGLFYKIPLLLIVGVGGMAYFLSAYHVYSLLFVLSAAGLPTALSLLVSRAVAKGERGAVGRVFGVSLAVFFLVGALGTLSLILFAPQIAAGLGMREADQALIAIAPALMLAAFVGAGRGVFQGFHNMVPTAVSEVIEAIGKLVFGVLLAHLAKERGASTPTVAAAAILGITLGVALSALFLALAMLYCRRQLFSSAKRKPTAVRCVLADILRVALPVTVSASVMSLVSLVDTALISNRLQAIGYAPAVANAMYSSYGNLAVPLYNLVPALLAPITLSLTPMLSAAFAAKDGEGVAMAFGKALRLAALVVLPAALGLSVFANPLLALLYMGQDAAILVAAPLLSVLAAALLPAVLIALAGAALQAAGKPAVPVFAMLAGAGVKLISEAILLSLPSVHILGAPISTLACNLTVLAVDLAVLSRCVPFPLFSARAFLRPLAAAVIAVALGGVAYAALVRACGTAAWQMPLVLLPVALLYLALALWLGAIRQDDIEEIPGGKTICRMLIKCNLLQEVKNNDKRRKAEINT